MRNTLILCLLILMVASASASKKTFDIEAGMTKQQVIKILGKPANRSFRDEDEAWQYQEVVGFGQCSYTTIWFRKATVIAMTSRRGKSVAGCGLGSHEVDWNEMPKSAT